MAIALTTHDNLPAVEIVDHKGEVRLYLFRLGPSPGWSVRLAKVDPESGEAEVEYAVRNPRGDEWACSCADFKYRPQVRERGCKHVRAGRELKQLLQSLQGATTP